METSTRLLWCLETAVQAWIDPEGRPTPRRLARRRKTCVCRRWRGPWRAGFWVHWPPPLNKAADSPLSQLRCGPGFWLTVHCSGDEDSSNLGHPVAGTDRVRSGRAEALERVDRRTAVEGTNCTWNGAESSSLYRVQGWSSKVCWGLQHQTGEQHMESIPEKENWEKLRGIWNLLLKHNICLVILARPHWALCETKLQGLLKVMLYWASQKPLSDPLHMNYKYWIIQCILLFVHFLFVECCWFSKLRILL